MAQLWLKGFFVLFSLFNSFYSFIIIFKGTVLVPFARSFQRSSMFLLCITLSTADIKIHLKLTEGSPFVVAR